MQLAEEKCVSLAGAQGRNAGAKLVRGRLLSSCHLYQGSKEAAMVCGLRLRDKESSLISNCIIGVLYHTRQGSPDRGSGACPVFVDIQGLGCRASGGPPLRPQHIWAPANGSQSSNAADNFRIGDHPPPNASPEGTTFASES